jgi:hypothetical protein
MRTTQTMVELANIREQLNQIDSRLARVEALVSVHNATCPYREDIARARNNNDRIKILEEQINDMRLTSARNGAMFGGVVALISSILPTLLRALGLI